MKKNYGCERYTTPHSVDHIHTAGRKKNNNLKQQFMLCLLRSSVLFLCDAFVWVALGLVEKKNWRKKKKIFLRLLFWNYYSLSYKQLLFRLLWDLTAREGRRGAVNVFFCFVFIFIYDFLRPRRVFFCVSWKILRLFIVSFLKVLKCVLKDLQSVKRSLRIKRKSPMKMTSKPRKD